MSSGEPPPPSSGNGNGNVSPIETYLIIKQSEALKKENIVTSIAARFERQSGFLSVQLNGKYNNQLINSDIIYNNWMRTSGTLDNFEKAAKSRGLQPNHISLIKNSLDDDFSRIRAIISSIAPTTEVTARSPSSPITGFEGGLNEAASVIAATRGGGDRAGDALRIVTDKIVETFPDDTKKPYIAVKVDQHIEVMALEDQPFKDWLGYEYYSYYKKQTEELERRWRQFQEKLRKEQGQQQQQQQQQTPTSNNPVRRFGPVTLPDSDIKKCQDILRHEGSKSAVKKLYRRVVENIDTKNKENNWIKYDLCNSTWDYILITPTGWEIVKNSQEIIFKRHEVNTAQVLPDRDYPSDILDQFMRLTNVAGDEDNKLLAKCYLFLLFLLAVLPKPILMPHGTKGSGKTTFQEFFKLVIDPSAALTQSFPRHMNDMGQVLCHSYFTIFDNVSEISEDQSNELCRAVTGGTDTKRAHYENEKDYIFNIMGAVGYNGINIVATRSDLLDRLLMLELGTINKKARKKLQDLREEFERILPKLLGFIFDTLAKVLNRIGEVKLEELPRMADFAEMGELVARVLGFDDNKFTEAYNHNIGYSNEEAIAASHVANAIIAFMQLQPTWTGTTEELRTNRSRPNNSAVRQRIPCVFMY